MILGIDVSTSITGFSIFGDQKLLHYGSIDLRKHDDLFDKALVLKEHLENYFEAYQLNNEGGWGNSDFPITNIYIEQPLHMFMKGKSSAKTISKLMRFNGIVSYIIYDLFEIKPQYIAASSARKECGIKIKRGEKAKEVVLNHTLNNEKAFKIEYTKFGNPKPESYDRADAIVIAKAGFLIEQKNTMNKHWHNFLTML